MLLPCVTRGVDRLKGAKPSIIEKGVVAWAVVMRVEERKRACQGKDANCKKV